MKKKWIKIFLFMFLWISIPILLILVIQEKNTLKIKQENSLEDILPFYVAMYIQEDFDIENIKAMAVICRSNLNEMIQKNGDGICNLKKIYGIPYKEVYIKRKNIYQQVIKACKETEGEVLKFQGKICYCPFFYVSSGITRDVFTIFKETKYPYLISVPSHKDEFFSEYRSYHYFEMEDFTKEESNSKSSEKENKEERMDKENYNENNDVIEIIERDPAGYVLWIKVGNQIMGGESFRQKYRLSSSCFSIEENENQIRIICKGKGHGFGYSQYGANEMAKDKKTYKDLLKHYFPLLNIEKCV